MEQNKDALSLALYMHAGSGNHGCEAIVDSLVRMLPDTSIALLSCGKTEDETYLPREVRGRLSIYAEQEMSAHFLTHVLYYIYRKLTGDGESFLRYRYASVAGKKAEKPKVAVSIGGDNYCYPSMVGDLMLANSMFQRQGTKTILLGCSIEPELIEKDAKVRADIASYEKIIARESITYHALLHGGIPAEKVVLCPDPAFTLPASEEGLPEDFASGNTVGINLSPMALDFSRDRETTLKSYEALIRHILDTTSMDVALIPHVVWARNDDRIPLGQLKEAFANEKRVRLIPDLPAEQLKGIIANCRFFIGARTHATIAAYSTLVPTLVIGYSVKARGIATDLFGAAAHYVLPVQGLTDPQQLIDAWKWLTANEDEIRYALAGAVPLYRKRAEGNAEEISKVLNL